MLTYLALGAIRLYQSVLSPYKGFRCAYAACTGCASCSVLGYRAIRRFGVRKGITVLQWRFEECSKAYLSVQERRPMALGKQRGDCDCGGCNTCDVAECFSDLADCGEERKKRRRHGPAQASWWRRLIHRFRSHR